MEDTGDLWEKYVKRDFRNKVLVLIVLNYFSSQLQSKATFKSEFYISNLASAFMSTDTFSSTDPITKNIKEENYKGHSKID